MKDKYLHAANLVITIALFSYAMSIHQVKRDNYEDIEQIGARLSNLQSAFYEEVRNPTLKSSANFQIGKEGFQRIETSVGYIFVSLADVQKYANGYKVIFDLGNPYNASITNINATLRYGKGLSEYIPEDNVNDFYTHYKSWEDNLKVAERSIVNEIYGGSWNKVTFIISPAKEEDLETLHLSLSATALIMRNMQ